MVTNGILVSSEVPIGGDFRVVVTSGQAFYAHKSRVMAQWHPVEMRWVPCYGLSIAISYKEGV